MIRYNMRYRGPYEYDKFVLNILQLYNAVNLAEINEFKITNEQEKSIMQLNSLIDDYYNQTNKIIEDLCYKYKSCN